MQHKDSFSDRLQLFAKSKKIYQADIAVGLKKDRATVNRWWNGLVTPTEKSIDKIADYLGCNPLWLATGEGEPFLDEKKTPYPVQDEQIAPVTSESEALKQVRMYRELAQMDEDTLLEIQTWLNDMDKLRPGFKGWFRLEFQNRFPEFDEWKMKITKNRRTGTDN